MFLRIRLIKYHRCDMVELREIAIEHHALAADGMDGWEDGIGGHKGVKLGVFI